MENSFWGGFRSMVFFIAFALLSRWYGRGCILGSKDKGTAHACYFKVVAEVSLNSGEKEEGHPVAYLLSA